MCGVWGVGCGVCDAGSTCWWGYWNGNTRHLKTPQNTSKHLKTPQNTPHKTHQNTSKHLSSGQIISDFGFGPWKKAAMDFLDTFKPAYRLVEQRIGAPGMCVMCWWCVVCVGVVCCVCTPMMRKPKTHMWIYKTTHPPDTHITSTHITSIHTHPPYPHPLNTHIPSIHTPSTHTSPQYTHTLNTHITSKHNRECECSYTVAICYWWCCAYTGCVSWTTNGMLHG